MIGGAGGESFLARVGDNLASVVEGGQKVASTTWTALKTTASIGFSGASLGGVYHFLYEPTTGFGFSCLEGVGVAGATYMTYKALELIRVTQVIGNGMNTVKEAAKSGIQEIQRGYNKRKPPAPVQDNELNNDPANEAEEDNAAEVEDVPAKDNLSSPKYQSKYMYKYEGVKEEQGPKSAKRGLKKAKDRNPQQGKKARVAVDAEMDEGEQIDQVADEALEAAPKSLMLSGGPGLDKRDRVEDDERNDIEEVEVLDDQSAKKKSKSKP